MSFSPTKPKRYVCSKGDRTNAIIDPDRHPSFLIELVFLFPCLSSYTFPIQRGNLDCWLVSSIVYCSKIDERQPGIFLQRLAIVSHEDYRLPWDQRHFSIHVQMFDYLATTTMSFEPESVSQMRSQSRALIGFGFQIRVADHIDDASRCINSTSSSM